MEEQWKPSPLSRRGFLKTIGWMAGAAVVAPFLTSRASIAGASSRLPGARGVSVGKYPLKIGMLLPESELYPAMGDNLKAGIKLFFDQGQAQAADGHTELVTETIGLGFGQAVPKARKLITEDRVDLVVGILNSSVAARLRKVFEGSRTFLIVSNVGANTVRADEQSPFVFYNSLSFWQASRAMGSWAARNLGRKAFVASSFYESGYDVLYAFAQGFEGAGGKILQTFVSHIPADTRGFGSVLAEIESAKPDFVSAFYSGQQAIDFVKAYADSGLASRIPLVGSAFLADEAVLAAQGRTALGIKSCLSWAASMNTPENQAFITAYRARTGHLPDAFSVLGYDTAQLMHHAVQAVAGDLSRHNDLRIALSTAKFTSPRGLVQMDPHTQSAISPLYLREVRHLGPTLSNVVLGELDSDARMYDRALTTQPGLKTGWLNAYLSV
jgi:branched-chain amino acid transport system substrate-binding protein